MWGAEGKTVLLYVGRVSWEKNLRCLARAYLEVWKRRKDVHLVVTGDGPARTELEGMFLDVKASVTFTGYLEGTVPRYPKVFPRHISPYIHLGLVSSQFNPKT